MILMDSGAKWNWVPLHTGNLVVARTLFGRKRESDIYELFDQKQAAPKNVHLLVRAQPQDGPAHGALVCAAVGHRVLAPSAQGRLDSGAEQAWAILVRRF